MLTARFHHKCLSNLHVTLKLLDSLERFLYVHFLSLIFQRYLCDANTSIDLVV